MNKTSIIVDASKYIGDLKEKVERLNQETGTSQAATAQNSLPVVNIAYNCITLFSIFFISCDLQIFNFQSIYFLILFVL